MSQPAHTRSTDKSARVTYLSVSDYGDEDPKTDYDVEKRIARQSTTASDISAYKSISHRDHDHHRFYKPKSNRSWVLSLFLTAIAICIALLEVTVHTHPDAKSVPKLPPKQVAVDRRTVLYVRQEDASGSGVSSATEPTIEVTTQSTVSPTTEPEKTTTPPADDTKSTTPGQPAPDSQVTITTSAVTSQPSPDDGLTGMPNPDDQVSITTTSPVAPGQPAPDDQITISTTSITPQASPGTALTITTSKPEDRITINSDNNQGKITTSENGGTGAPNPNDQVSITTDRDDQVSHSPNPDDQVTITSITAHSPNPENQVSITVGNPDPDNQMTVTNQNSGNTGPTPGAPAPSDQLSVTNANGGGSNTGAGTTAGPVTLAGLASVVSGSLIVSGTAVVGTAPQAAAASVVSGSLIVSGSSILATVQQNAVQGTSAGAAALGLVTLTDSAGRPTATVAYTGDVVATDRDGKAVTVSYNGNIVLTDSNGVATKTLSDAVVMTDSHGKATKTLSYADSVVLTGSDGAATKTVLYTGVATQAASAVDSTSADASLSKHKFTQWSYFLAIYLPNIIGVLLQSFWLIVFMTFKLMEPFYRLASPGGASAETTLLADYMSAGLSASIFKTAAEGHWVLILVGAVQFCLAMAMLFVSSSMSVVPTAYCKTEIGNQQPCNPVWVVNTEMIRILELFLVACFSMIIMIIILNRKRVSGVYSDPSKISTVADVLVHKPLIHEFRDIPATSSQKDIALDLRDNRYMLGTFDDNGREQYGIMKIAVGLDHTQTFTKESSYVSAYRRVAASIDGLTETLTKPLPFLPEFLCMTFSIILFSIVLAYYSINGKTKGNTFNDWMNSSRIGPGILLSTLGIGMGFLVKRKERYFRLSHSYVILSKGPTLASEAVTQSTHTSPFDSVYHASRSGNLNLALLAMAAIFTDVILMLAPSIPFSPAQTRPVYLSSTYIVLILSALTFVIIAHITWIEWSTASSDQRSSSCPETLAAVLLRLCASRFVDEKNMMNLGPYLEGSANDHDRLQRVRYEGVDGKRRYTYGVMEGLDGVQRHMVEEDVHSMPHVLTDRV